MLGEAEGDIDRHQLKQQLVKKYKFLLSIDISLLAKNIREVEAIALASALESNTSITEL
jgi:hypothetical protein